MPGGLRRSCLCFSCTLPPHRRHRLASAAPSGACVPAVCAPFRRQFKGYYRNAIRSGFVSHCDEDDPEVLQRTIASLGVNYGISNHGDTSPHLSLDAWTDQATTQPGSLWPAWHGWLAQHSGPAAKPLTLGGMGRQRRAAMCCRPEP